MPTLFAGVFMAALDTAVIAPALPVLRESFGLDHRASGLVMTVYVLCSLCSTALMSNLGDRHGRRPVFLACISLFALGSVLIALAPDFTVLLLGRAIQGIGGGGIIPTAGAVIGDALPPARRARALGLMGATYGMAFVFGPPLAAVLMLAFSWQWIFLANLPIALGVLHFGRQALPARSSTPSATVPPRMDWLGMFWLVALLVLLVLCITQLLPEVGSAWLLAGAALALLLLVKQERQVEARGGRAMVPISLFRRRQLGLAYFLTFGAGFGMGAIVFLSAVAIHAHGVSSTRGGFALMPMVLASIVGSVGSSRLLRRLGTRWVVFAGFLFMMLGYAGIAWTTLGLAGFLSASVPVGLGVGVAVGGALRSLALDESPAELRGAAQGLVNVFTSVGTLVAASVIGSLADLAGGGVPGLSAAFDAVAALLLCMALAATGLRGRNDRTELAGTA